MKVLFLAGGFGTRIKADIESDGSPLFTPYKDTPKPLLPIHKKPLINYWFESLSAQNIAPKDMFLVSNAAHYDQYVSWAKETGFETKNILRNTATDNAHRNGALKDLELGLAEIKSDDVFIIGGDTLLLPEDMNLAKTLKSVEEGKGSAVFSYTCSDEQAKNSGIIEVDEKMQLKSLTEKPSKPASRQACPCLYVLKNGHANTLSTYLASVKDKAATSVEKDSTGSFISWLVSTKAPITVFPIQGRFDVGNLKSLIEANQYMTCWSNAVFSIGTDVSTFAGIGKITGYRPSTSATGTNMYKVTLSTWSLSEGQLVHVFMKEQSISALTGLWALLKGAPGKVTNYNMSTGVYTLTFEDGTTAAAKVDELRLVSDQFQQKFLEGTEVSTPSGAGVVLGYSFAKGQYTVELSKITKTGAAESKEEGVTVYSSVVVDSESVAEVALATNTDKPDYSIGDIVSTPYGTGTIFLYRPAQKLYGIVLSSWELSEGSKVKVFCRVSAIKEDKSGGGCLGRKKNDHESDGCGMCTLA